MREIDLSGRVAVVTGGSRNIGRAISLGLAEAGAHVLVGYGSDTATAEETCRDAAALGGSAEPLLLPLEDADGFPGILARATGEDGRVDILVNSAAIRPRQVLGTVTSAEWDEVFAINVRAPFFLAQTVIPGMISRGYGRVICIGGISAYIGQTDRPAVIASKLAVVGVVRALAFDTAKTGVTVNAVVPGTIDTERGEVARYGAQRAEGSRESNVPLGRLGRPEDVAAMCCFLASDYAGYATGQEFFVSGGSHPLTSRGVG